MASSLPSYKISHNVLTQYRRRNDICGYRLNITECGAPRAEDKWVLKKFTHITIEVQQINDIGTWIKFLSAIPAPPALEDISIITTLVLPFGHMVAEGKYWSVSRFGNGYLLMPNRSCKGLARMCSIQ